MGLAGAKGLSTRNCRYGRAVIEKRRTDPAFSAVLLKFSTLLLWLRFLLRARAGWSGQKPLALNEASMRRSGKGLELLRRLNQISGVNIASDFITKRPKHFARDPNEGRLG